MIKAAIALTHLGGLKGYETKADSLIFERPKEVGQKAATKRWNNAGI